MQAFKTSVKRKIFIDKKIRENTFPSTVTLAIDYEKEFKKKIDPRTIASDIAELRQIYKAPLKYDAKQKGYYYTDSSFHLNVLAISDTDNCGGEKVPKEIVIPDWQKNFLFPFMTEVLPARKENEIKASLFSSCITVLPSIPESAEITSTENLFMKSLTSGQVLSIEICTNNNEKDRYDFLPLHLVCQGEERLYFGKEISETKQMKETFSLLNIKQIITASFSYSSHSEKLHQKEIAETEVLKKKAQVYSLGPRDSRKIENVGVSYYAQTTGNLDIEIIMERNDETHIFVFTCYPSVQSKSSKKNYRKVGEFILNSLN